MTLLDIAQSMRGRLRDGYSARQSGVTVDGGAVEYGTVVSVSDGTATIVLDSSPDQSAAYQYEVPVDFPAQANDRVAYVRENGFGKVIALERLTSIAENADTAASEAQAVAEAVNQHFWDDTNGAHVTEVEQGKWTDSTDPLYHTGRDITLNSNGIILREDYTPLASFTPSAVAFYDGQGDQAANVTASFGTSGAVIGKTGTGESRVEVTSDGMRIISNETGNDWTVAEMGIGDYGGHDYPYFTFGSRWGTAGLYSFTAGLMCEATGDCSVAVGKSTVANDPSQMAIGEFNVYDANAVMMVGNGTDDNNRSNAFTVGFNGDITAGGEVIDGYGNKLSDPCDLSTATGTLAIASGGSGDNGTKTHTTVSDIITAGTGITITEAHYCTWGKVAMLMVGLKRSTAISAGGAITIGSVKSGHRPVTDAAGGSNTLNGWLSTGGNFTARNISGSQISANTAIYISLTYLLP